MKIDAAPLGDTLECFCTMQQMLVLADVDQEDVLRQLLQAVTRQLDDD